MSNKQDIIEEIQQAAAWAKGPYDPAPPGWERSDAPFRAKDEIAFLRNQIQQMQWQPIETAPDEGRFLVYMPDHKRQPIQVADWHTNMKVIGNAFAFDMPPPTHWMPLPPPPTTT